MPKLVLILTVSTLIAAHYFGEPKVYVHQNGCHSAHSCPSDFYPPTYICGDTGRTRYCGDENTEPIIDEYQHGIDKAIAYIGNNVEKQQLIQSATTSGSDDGESAARYNEDRVYTGVNDFCTLRAYNIDITGNPPEDYESAFRDTYEEECKKIYNPLYSSSFTSGYDKETNSIATAEAENAAVAPLVLASDRGVSSERALTFTIPIVVMLGIAHLVWSYLKNKRI